MGASRSTSVCTLEKDVYGVGDTIRVRISCDNTRCKKPVKGFKLKLLRNLQCVTYTEDSEAPCYTNHQKYVAIEKIHENVDAREHIELATELILPEQDDYNPESFASMR
mmetsp:Transcript_3707/g.4238  ORF Transcript_3707/g.4238 Transcript_3707/m.4238 type:complete len:109 (+) Transcript_3707:904-1230(+)